MLVQQVLLLLLVHLVQTYGDQPQSKDTSQYKHVALLLTSKRPEMNQDTTYDRSEVTILESGLKMQTFRLLLNR